MNAGLSVALAISAGVRKIPLPMVTPTMIAAPPQKPMVRGRSGGGPPAISTAGAADISGTVMNSSRLGFIQHFRQQSVKMVHALLARWREAAALVEPRAHAALYGFDD